MLSQKLGTGDWGRCNKRRGHDNDRKQKDDIVHFGMNRLPLCSN
jgi:hypothetical protein